MEKENKPSSASSSVKTSEDKKATAGKELNIEEIKKQLEEAEKKAAEYLAGWQRARADLLNYKKEEMERMGELIKYSAEEFILKLLPVLDSFNLAVKQDEKSAEGFMQIKKQLEDLLKNFGVEELKTIGEKFDPNFHEVIEETEAKGNGSTSSPQVEPGTIMEEVQRGYIINGKLLRPAKVKVAR